MKMRAKIIAGVMKGCMRRLELNVFGEHSIECLGVMVLGTFTENTPGFRAKNGHEIGGAVSAVVELSAHR